MQELTPYLSVVLVVLLLFTRTQRSRRMEPKYLWVAPAIFLLLMALFVYGAARANTHYQSMDFGWVVIATLVGAALGAVRARTLTLTRASDGAIEAKLSMWGLAFLLAWMVLRTALRQQGFSGAAHPFGVFNFAMLAMVCASLISRAVVLMQRCAALPSELAPAQAETRQSA